MYFARTYYLRRDKVPLLEINLRIFENPYLQRKLKLRRRRNCGELRQFTQILRLPTIFNNISNTMYESVCQISMPKIRFFA